MSNIKQQIKILDKKNKARFAEKIRQKLKQRKVSQTADYDVVILGGGFAGSTLARQLKLLDRDITIAVVERNSFPYREIAHKVGESASELQAHYLSEILELRDHLTKNQIEKGGARYFFTYGNNKDISQRMEVGLKAFPPVPGFQFDRGRLENHLYAENSAAGIKYWENSKFQDLIVGSPNKVLLNRDDEQYEITANWVVDATGRGAVLKRKFGLKESSEHPASSAWLRVGFTMDLETWSDSPDWQQRVIKGLRKMGTCHLMGKGYWVWIIVLPSNATSIGIVADPAIHPLSDYNSPERFLKWLQTHEPQLAEALREDIEQDQIKDFLAIKNFAHGCKQLFSEDKWCITGEAGLFMDPFYSPGGDFIAISNSLVSDLIMQDRQGKPIASLIRQYESSYVSLFKQYLKTYLNQYPVMGNQKVMLAKIAWDWAIYWGVNAFLFFHQNRAFDWNWLSACIEEMNNFKELNEATQSLFQFWSDLESADWHDCMYSLFDLEFLYEMHIGLKADLPPQQAQQQLRENIQTLAIISQEYAKHVNSMVKSKQQESNESNPANVLLNILQKIDIPMTDDNRQIRMQLRQMLNLQPH